MRQFYLIIYLSFFIFQKSNQKCSSDTEIISREDCLKNSTEREFCCFYNSECKLVEREYLFKGENASYDCGINELNYGKYEFREYHPKQTFSTDLKLKGCGELEPKKRNQCNDYSELTNSCCFFKNQKGETGCFLIGKKYLGEIKERSFIFEKEKITYECMSFYLEINIFSVAIVGMFLLFI